MFRQLRAPAPQVDFPLGDGDDPHGFACAGGKVNCYYKHKHLRAAFSNIPHAAKDASNVSTKVGERKGRCITMHALSYNLLQLLHGAWLKHAV